MRRRDFLSVLGGAAASWPLAVRAQQAALPVIGFMSGRSAPDSTQLVAAFRESLGEAGANATSPGFCWRSIGAGLVV